MLEFFAQYGADLTAILVAASGLAGSVFGLVKMFKTGKHVDKSLATTKEDIQITREGIVEAFKTAKIPSEWKVTVSNQVNTILNEWKDDFLKILEKNQAVTVEILIYSLKILKYTAAANKLSEDDKNRITDLIKQITDEDATIDVT